MNEDELIVTLDDVDLLYDDDEYLDTLVYPLDIDDIETE